MSLFIARDRALPSTWRSYSQNLRIHPSATISPDATLTCFGSPAESAVILEIGEGSFVEGNLALAPVTRQKTQRVSLLLRGGSTRFRGGAYTYSEIVISHRQR